MSDNKKYYYLKLKDNFFDSDAMIVLESMPDGYKYSNILLKLYLRSLKHNGKLMFNDRIPYNSTILAQVTRHSVGDVEKSVSILAELGLIEVLNNGAIYMLDIQNFIGESSTEGDRKRAYRRKIEQEKNMLLGEGQMSDKSTDVHPPEIEIELEIDKEIEKEESSAKAEPPIPYQEIVTYLNEVAGTKFRHKAKETQRLIKARVNDGYSIDDFKQVIDTKAKQWIKDKNMNIYLRPQTLFGTKFEAYLNESHAIPRELGHTQHAPKDESELVFDDTTLKLANDLVESGKRSVDELTENEKQQLNNWRLKNGYERLVG